MEEDIKILEKFCKNPIGVNYSETRQSIQNLIAGYKELKENYINPSKARISYFDKGKGIQVVIEGFVPTAKIKELKEKVHELLDKNGIARAYQLMIDKYFDELLEE